MSRSVVVPVYRNEATLPALLLEIAELRQQRPDPFEVVFVIDGSPDNSYALLKQRLPEMPFHSQIVSLSRNFGSFAAIRAGLTAAKGEFIAILAADLQQPVSSVGQFFDSLEHGADIVVGQRSSRHDPWLSRVAATTFWKLYRRFVQPEMPVGGADSFACRRHVRDVLVALPEATTALVGLLFWVGFRREIVIYPRAARASGRSGWTLGRKLRYAFDTAFAFSDLPITTIVTAGLVGIGGSMVAIVAVLIGWMVGAVDVRGYTPVMLALLLSFSTTLLALGIVGGYVWRIFENTKGRPIPLVHLIEQIAPAVSAGAAPYARADSSTLEP